MRLSESRNLLLVPLVVPDAVLTGAGGAAAAALVVQAGVAAIVSFLSLWLQRYTLSSKQTALAGKK